MIRVLSPQALAVALGVSESSVKRWVDDGKLRAARTPKGHRRIDVDEALRFIRATRLQIVRPDLLGIGSAARDAGTRTPDDLTEALHAALLEGNGVDVMGLTLGRYLGGHSLASLFDGPLHAAMGRVGELWHQGPQGIFVEHRATTICLETLRAMRRLMDVPSTAPLALVAAPGGDPSTITTTMLSVLLAGEGLRAVDLGANTPSGAIQSAVKWHSPFLLCVSATHVQNRKQLSEDLDTLAGLLLATNSHLAIGGHDHRLLKIPKQPNVFHSDKMGDLTGFCRGLLAPKPGMPV